MGKTTEKPGASAASGAIIMSLGIFLNGAVTAFPPLNGIANFLVMLLFMLWLWIAVYMVKPLFAGKFRNVHLQSPLQSFAIGTWVAGTAVCAVDLLKDQPHWAAVARMLIAASFVLWLFYLCVCFRNFKELLRGEQKWQVDGVILLSTVSTQSIVISLKTQHFLPAPNELLTAFLLLGGILYLFCFGLIAARYCCKKSWNLVEDWKNTNCILHGAMSITGLAGTISGLIEENLLLAIWLWVFSWFVIVETVEILRALVRIRKLGWSAAIGIYHVSQWSRIFTFGMFYAFTMNMHSPFLTGKIPFLTFLRDGILSAGSWIVLLLIINEGLLMFKMKWGGRFFHPLKQEKMQRQL